MQRRSKERSVSFVKQYAALSHSVENINFRAIAPHAQRHGTNTSVLMYLHTSRCGLLKAWCSFLSGADIQVFCCRHRNCSFEISGFCRILFFDCQSIAKCLPKSFCFEFMYQYFGDISSFIQGLCDFFFFFFRPAPKPWLLHLFFLLHRAFGDHFNFNIFFFSKLHLVMWHDQVLHLHGYSLHRTRTRNVVFYNMQKPYVMRSEFSKQNVHSWLQNSTRNQDQLSTPQISHFCSDLNCT